jgi:hypothetical protein
MIKGLFYVLLLLAAFCSGAFSVTSNISVEGRLDVTGTIDATSRIGIGTTSPAHALDVVGSMYSRRYAATVTIDWNGGNVQSLTLANGSNTLTFSNGQDGGKYILILKQPASGAAGTVSWPVTVRWPGGTAITLTTTNAKTDYIGFIYNGVDSKYDGIAYTLNL